MTIQLFNGATVYFDGYDVTGNTNSVTIDQGAEAKDATVFGATTKTNVAGLLTASIGLQGFWTVAPDLGMINSVGTNGKLISVAPTGTAGDVAYMMKAVVGQYSCAGQMGEVFPYSLNAAAGGNLLRGLLCEKRTGFTATANGTARQLGAVAANHKIYAGLHVTSFSGTNPTLDVVLKSAASDSWGAPTTQISMTQATGLTSELKELSGAITDTWWRPTLTIGGSNTPTFSFNLIIAIL